MTDQSPLAVIRACKNCYELFEVRKIRGSGWQQKFCDKTCLNRWHHKQKRANPKYDAWRRAAYERRRATYLAIIDEAKAGGCIRCGESHPACLQFHHRDPSTKLFAITRWSKSALKLRAEIAKCDILCANCHFKHHAAFPAQPKIRRFRTAAPKGPMAAFAHL